MLVAALAAWRITVSVMATTLADSDPHAALAWNADQPQALLALARKQLAADQPEQAAATASRLLQREPLAAEALVVRARAAAASQNTPEANRLFALALKRAPRDQYARAWVIGDELQSGRYTAALANITTLVRIAPPRAEVLVPLLAEFAAQTPAFVPALVHALGEPPPWRFGLLDYLLRHAGHELVDRVFSGLQSTAGLSREESERWFQYLIGTGRWGEAYSRWAGGLGLAAGANLPAIYNGGFEKPVSGIGFDWVMRGEPGVQILRSSIHHRRGRWSAQVNFLNRRANNIQFQQNLLLGPGRYRLRFSARARNLRSDKGLEWAITCAGQSEPLATSPRMEGSFDWQLMHTDFTVPASACPAQLLWLRNPGADGAAKLVSGTLWFDNFRITTTQDPTPSP